MPYGLKEIELAKLSKVFASNEHIKRVILYGSRAKGNYKLFSDVDITLEGPELTLTDLNHLSLAIDDLLLPYQFDISIFHTLKNHDLIDHIQRIGITIFERESEWKEYKLGEIISIASGFAYKGEYIGEGDRFLLGMGCVSYKEKFLYSGARPYAGDCAERYYAKAGDIVLATRQQSDNLPILGMPAIIPEELKDKKLIVGANLYRVINDSDFDNKYLYWLLKTPSYVKHIASCKTGTTVAMITKADIENFVFVAPDKQERERILETISSLDDKIDLLHRENATLEQMAETLFRQWFVVEANEEWEEGKLGDICNYVTEKIDIGNVETGDYISTENMCPNKQGVVLASSVPENGKATKYRIDDVLLSNIRPYFKKIWLSDREGGCSADVLCIRGKNELYAFFSYYTIRQDEFFDYVMLGSKGCKMPRGDKSHIMNWPIIIPPKDELLKFNEIAKQGITKIRNNNKQIQTLIQTRDGLLPKLMSNEIKV